MQNEEFVKITQKIVNNRKFIKLKKESHHFITNRYNHSVEVAYKTYKVTKFLHLDYINITKAALMHDFYFNSDFRKHSKGVFCHPYISLNNAKKLVNLDKKQENIILSHMFPFGGKIPKYKESIIVDLLDDFVSIKEFSRGNIKCLNTAISFLFVILISYLR